MACFLWGKAAGLGLGVVFAGVGVAPKGQAAVDLQHLAGEKTLLGSEPQRGIGNVGGRADAPQRVFLDESLLQPGKSHLVCRLLLEKKTCRNGVHSYALLP